MSSPIRGRALVINNKNFISTKLRQRVGSDADVMNITGLLTALMFELTVATDLSAQVNPHTNRGNFDSSSTAKLNNYHIFKAT